MRGLLKLLVGVVVAASFLAIGYLIGQWHQTVKDESTKAGAAKAASDANKAAVAKLTAQNAAKADAEKDAGKASQAAEAVANAAADAVANGETVDGVVDASQVMVEAFNLAKNPVGAVAARAVANAASARRDEHTANPQDVADAARKWADAIKKAEGKTAGGKASGSTAAFAPRSSFTLDVPPASAKVAFESVLSLGVSPTMSAAGDYEYSMFATTPAPGQQPRRIGCFAVKYETTTQSQVGEEYARRAGWAGAHAIQSQLVSLANPGLGYSVSLRKDQNLIIGLCSFDDAGKDPRYNWVAFERDSESPRQWMAYKILPGDGRDLKLFEAASLKDVEARGPNQIVVAKVGGILHFPTYDAEGKMTSDVDENMLTNKSDQITQLLRKLNGLWPPHELTNGEKLRLVDEVASILDKPRSDWPSPQARDLVEDALSIDQFSDQRVSLGLGPEVHSLGAYPRGTLLHEHGEWEELRSGSPWHDAKYKRWPTVRVVISGDVITFSIEVDYKAYDTYRLAGEYHSSYFPTAAPEQRAALSERVQYGAVKVRSRSNPSEETLDRAAAYGADVLRRRAESLIGPEILRKEKLGDNNHLVLLVRNARSGETSWLGVKSTGGGRLSLSTSTAQARQKVQFEPVGSMVEPLALPSAGLACPKISSGEPACSYPLFIGGEEGSRLVEIWLVRKQRTSGHFDVAPTPLFDVQYLFLLPR